MNVGATSRAESSPAPHVAIIGSGGMGRLLAGLLAPDVGALTLVDSRFTSPEGAVDLALDGLVRALRNISADWRYSRVDPTHAILTGAGRVVTIECLPPADSERVLRLVDVVVLALPYHGESQFDAAVTPYVSILQPGVLVTDTASLKVGPLRVLEARVPPTCDLLGMHPIFGPGVMDVTGQVVALTSASDARPVSPWRTWLTETLVRRRLLLTPCTAEEHDLAMTHVQALAHFVLLSLARCIVRGNVEPSDLLPFRSPVFEPLVYLAARVAILAWDSPETYVAIQRQAGAAEIREQFVAAAQELRTVIDSDSDDGTVDQPSPSIEELLVKTGAYWGHLPTDLKTDPHERVGADIVARLDRRSSDPFRRSNILGVSNSATATLANIRRDVLDSAGRVRALRDERTGAVSVGLIYVDPERHDKVDLSSRVRFRRINLPTGAVYDPGWWWPDESADQRRQEQVEAALASLPLTQARFLSDSEFYPWLDQLLDRPSRPVGTDADDPGASANAHNRFAIRSTPAVALRVPDWFDESIVNRLLAGHTDTSDGSRVWSIRFAWLGEPCDGTRLAQLFLHCFLHPEALVLMRAGLARAMFRPAAGQLGLQELLPWALTSVPMTRDQQVDLDRQVRRLARGRIRALVDSAVDWLCEHGCDLPVH